MQMQQMQQQMDEMQKKYQQEIEDMRASHEAFRNKARSEKAMSVDSGHRKSYKEDEISALNDRADEVNMYSSKLDNFDNKTIASRHNSIINAQTVPSQTRLMRD